MLIILKFATIVATALFGVYASFADFRDQHRRVTRHGWIGLCGVISSALAAAAVQVASDHEQAETTAAMMRGFERTLHPLGGMRMQILLRPDWTKPYYQSYRTQLQAQFIAGNGLMFPSFKESPLIRTTVCDVGLTLLFFRHPIASTEFIKGTRRADLTVSIMNPCELSLRNLPGSYQWSQTLDGYHIKRLDMQIETGTLESTSDDWHSNASISSLEDLLGAQLIIQLWVGASRYGL